MFFAEQQWRNANGGTSLQRRLPAPKQEQIMGVLNIMKLTRSCRGSGSPAAAAAAAAFQRSRHRPDRPIKFTLDWKFEGPAAPFLVPLDKGYYKAEGLDVTIDTAGGSLEPLNRVASGTYDMGFGDINSLIKFRDANPNAPIKAIFMVYNKPAFSIVSRKSRGVMKPKDLEGKKLGAPAAGRRLRAMEDLHRRPTDRRLQGDDRERRLPGARADAGRAARSTPSPASRSRPTST